MANKKQIMVVNDDQIQNLICRKVFTMNLDGVEVLDFVDPSEALKAIVDKRAELKFILVDVNMPGMNGWEFIENVEKNGFEYPVVMFTASVDEEDREKASKTKMVKMFLDKPMTKDKLPLLEPLLNGEHD
ncbi:response regulator [Thermaurantimonas aggregans]|uniref:response regulator n=1 Tax=Thermaurantimonas aggregans TaxID=2173829 RepID=UPI0023EFB1EB|nr:response regulator [Thermaurantimonas aggregans]MCX8148964.1 response regulator [Thermaurantimonas aggregans]